jgi:hypothetical protein
MIIFELICTSGHRFEGWFASGDDFERQRLAGLLACPVCSTGEVQKLPTAKLGRWGDTAMGPERPARGEAEGHDRAVTVTRAQVAAAVAAVVDHVLQHTEDVGRAFPEEARQIHRELAPRRGIRGIATREETEALLEEGIPVVSLPIPPAEDYH